MQRLDLKGVFWIILVILCLSFPLSAEAGKYAIILQAGKKSSEGPARALHAFLYSKELKEKGHEVVLIFDGAGTTWVEELSDPESSSKLKPHYDAVRRTGIVQIICDYCAVAYDVKGQLVERELPLDGSYEGHPSIAEWADNGYQLLVL
ncbi:DsrE family protein [candidate division TA06 bacterium]|nr:DsrE family protein [candidate division TA06 bacterium]